MLKPKKIARGIVARRLEKRILRLKKQYNVKIIAVVGSVGKTTTKLAIAKVLQQKYKVAFQEGNYNDRVSIPLVPFGISMPTLTNPMGWQKVIKQIDRRLKSGYDKDVVVLELGIDHVGQMKEFAYLKPDIAVVTAVTPEHMEHFKDLDTVAREEMLVAKFSKIVIVNGDDCEPKYRRGLAVKLYGTESNYDYQVYERGRQVNLHLKNDSITFIPKVVGLHIHKALLAAAAIGEMLGLSHAEIIKGLESFTPFPGRMQILKGIKGSTIIDDTYNASPSAVIAALETVYAMQSRQKIAILGSMNELGEYSEKAHRDVGEACDPKQLALVVTVGQMAKDWLAPAAEKRGCKVVSFMSPYETGEHVKGMLQTGALVLVKGSQNRVFTEEAIKSLLANPADKDKLVRQAATWMKKKAEQFGDPPK